MDIEQFRDYCLSLAHTEECTPFDETTLVMKIGGKMYAYADMVDFEWVALKCDPLKAIELRTIYPEITPAYHSNKRHWNGVSTVGRLSDDQIKTWICDSYELVKHKLSRKAKETLQ